MYKEEMPVALKTHKNLQISDHDTSGEIEINMNDIAASVMSSSTISKHVPFSIYGILNLDRHISRIMTECVNIQNLISTNFT